MDDHKNFAYSTLAATASTAATSLTVATGEGARFPAVPFNATLWPASTQPLPTNAEIVRVTAISGDVFTVTRAQEASTAVTAAIGAQIAATITKKTLTDIEGELGISIEMGLFDAYALIRDEKSAGTNAGTFTQGAWRTRDLNTEKFDVGGIVSLSANQFTLQAGTYFFDAWADAGFVNSHQARIYNVSDSAVVAVGSLEYAGRVSQFNSNHSAVRGRVTIASAKTFELQHICVSSNADEGFGSGRDWGDSTVGVFSEVAIYREREGGAATPGEFVGAKAYHSAQQNINTTTAPALLDSEEYDSDGFHTAASTAVSPRMTIPEGLGGVYMIQGGTLGSGAADWIGFRKNGSTALRGYQTALTSGAFYRSASTIVELAAGEYVEMLVSTSSNIDIGHSSLPDAQSWLAISRLVGSALAIGTEAEDVAIEDAGGYFTAADVEAALQELGSDIIYKLFGAPTTAFEFKSSSTTGLTAFGSVDTESLHTTIADHLLLIDVGDVLVGRYAAAPSAPFTAIAKISEATFRINYMNGGIGVCEASPGKIEYIGLGHEDGFAARASYWSDPGTFSANRNTIQIADLGSAPFYVAVRVNSATDVDFLYSVGGRLWVLLQDALNPGFTIGGVPLVLRGGGSGSGAIFDYLRIWNTALTLPGA